MNILLQLELKNIFLGKTDNKPYYASERKKNHYLLSEYIVSGKKPDDYLSREYIVSESQ
jgi:hypothetical protein